MKPHILVFFGTRPEIIKIAPAIQSLRKDGAFRLTICDTGQHGDLNAPLIRWFGVQPDISLRLMRPDQNLGGFAARALAAVSGLISRMRPALVLCQGDTTTAMIAGLAAFYQRIPVGHIEAGLRTWNRAAPFPEEINRRIIGLVADLHFAPTRGASENLRAEKVPAQTIHTTGNTSIDALLWTVQQLKEKAVSFRKLPLELRHLASPTNGSPNFVLVTAHRRESFGAGMGRIGEAIGILARRHPAWKWVLPLHPNPNVGPVLAKRLRKHANVILCPPLDYPVFCGLLKNCRFVISDSGGVQEEAPALGKPVIVMRETTERPEARESGHLVLRGCDTDRIVRAAERWIRHPEELTRLARPVFPYGRGNSAQKILRAIHGFLKKQRGT